MELKIRYMLVGKTVRCEATTIIPMPPVLYPGMSLYPVGEHGTLIIVETDKLCYFADKSQYYIVYRNRYINEDDDVRHAIAQLHEESWTVWSSAYPDLLKAGDSDE